MICLHVPYKRLNVKFNIPQDWNELTARQMAWVNKRRYKWAELFELVKESGENADPSTLLHLDNSIQKLNIEVLTYLSGASFSKLGLRSLAWASLYPDETAWLFPDIQYLFKSNLRTTAPFPYVRVFGRKWVPAADALNNVTALEFHFADLCFNQYKKGVPMALENLCAILYRPKGSGEVHKDGHRLFCGDIREPFNNNSIEAFGRKLRLVPRWRLEAIAMWYEGCRTRIVENNKDIFNSSSESSGMGWLPVFRALAGGVTSIEDVGKQRMSLLLYELNELEHERRRQILLNKK